MVEVLSSVKYPCVDSDDGMVDAAIVLDYVRAISGLVLTAVVAYGYSVRHKLETTTVYHSNVSAVMCTILAVLFLGVVQQSEACMNCITEDDETFTEDLRRMIGGSSCADRLQSANFDVPKNYCRDQLDTLCTPTALGVVYAERCLVYACSTRVHGVGFRYVLGIIGMTLQLVVCIVILTDRGTLFKQYVDSERLKKRLAAEANELDAQVQKLRVQIASAIPASAPPLSKENQSTLRTLRTPDSIAQGAAFLYPRPARPGLRLRPNVSTYSRVRQLDF